MRAAVRPAVHPLAWWAWALTLGIATTRSPGIFSTGVLIASIILVVLLCHRDSRFSRAFPAYLGLAVMIVVIRVVFHILVGVKDVAASDIVLPLPSIPLPNWAGGIELFGPVCLSGLLSAVAAGLALAALLLCFGAAVALTDPQRTLRSLPASLHLLGTASVIAMTLTPQLLWSWQRVRRAQSLRGQHLRGWRAAAATAAPVMHDALERSLVIASSMDSRGYARARGDNNAPIVALMLIALLGATVGTYALVVGVSPRWLSIPVLAGGALAAALGSWLAARRVHTTRYRPDRWGLRETLIAGGGAAVAVLALVNPTAVSGGVEWWSATFILCAVLAATPIAVVMAP